MRRTRFVPVAFAALALIGGACGEGDQATGTTSTAPPSTVATTTPPSTSSTTATETTTSAAAEETTTTQAAAGPLRFDFAVVRGEDDPVLPDGDGDEWDATWTFAPSVVHHDGVFHLFYSGWGSTSIGIGYATSTNGVDFTRRGDGPVVRLAPDDRDLEAGRAVVRVLADGSWEMFIGEWVDRKTQGNRIWRATAPAPEGPWSVEPEPIFTSPTDSWGARIVPQAIVPGTDTVLYDGVRLYTIQVGALAPDGAGGWEPSDDPASTDRSLSVHDPVFGPATDDEANWDHAAVGSPIVFATEDGGYEMFYAGWWKDRTQTHDEWDWLGYATSDNGISWERYEANPVVELTNENGWLWMSGVEVDGTYYLYYAIQAGKHGIGLVQGTIADS